MRRILMMCGAIAMLLIQTAAAQDNNQSISDDLKKIWGDQEASNGTGLSMDGMYDTQAGTEDTGEIGFTDNVTSTPVDGGISLLLAAGLVAGVKRIRREVNKLKESESNPSK
jgi:hypothetical protein